MPTKLIINSYTARIIVINYRFIAEIASALPMQRWRLYLKRPKNRAFTPFIKEVLSGFIAIYHGKTG